MPAAVTPLKLKKRSHNALKIGAYELILILLQEMGFWNYLNPNRPPNIEGLSKQEIAEYHLIAGMHYGFFGIIYENGQKK